LTSAANQEYWVSRYEGVQPEFDAGRIGFQDLYETYLKPGGSCFEVGCYPGRHLIYMGKRFGYTANGIDWTPSVRTRTPEFLRANGVRVGQFYCADFEKFDCDRTFDFVYSLGFIEHFWNLEEIIKKHIALVKPGGTLFLSCPNFRGLQFVFHRIFDAKDLRAHVVDTMDLARWRRVLQANGMEVVREGYYRTVGFWTRPEAAQGFLGSVSGSLVRVTDHLDGHFRIPNRWLSPHMFSISRKVGDGGWGLAASAKTKPE